MVISQRELPTAAAEKQVLPNLQRVLADTSSPMQDIAADAVPIFGIRCDDQVIRRVTANRLERPYGHR